MDPKIKQALTDLHGGCDELTAARDLVEARLCYLNAENVKLHERLGERGEDIRALEASRLDAINAMNIWEDKYYALKSSRAPESWLVHEDAIIAHLEERIRPWLKDRKPSHLAFTAGLERRVAALIEEGILKRAPEVGEVETLKAEVNQLKHALDKQCVAIQTEWLDKARREGAADMLNVCAKRYCLFLDPKIYNECWSDWNGRSLKDG